VKVLLDVCTARTVATKLRDSGFGVKRVVEINEAMADEEILSLANSEQRVLITEDSDFGRLVVLSGRANHGVIRFAGVPARLQAGIAQEILIKYRSQLAAGAIITADMAHIRVRLQEDDTEIS
jgi:predicted nuclease of predicted toxin-antitoxin system